MSRVGRVLRAVCSVALVGVLGATLTAASAGCGVAVGPAYTTGYYDGYPPDGYIATTEPFYYEGRATYWYGGYWYYRDGGGRWGHYQREPAGLYQRRMQGPPGRHVYEGGRGGGGRGNGRGGGHPSGGGGGRGGGHR